MKKITLFIFSILLFISVNSQNLVDNPSFEQFNNCPNFVSQITFANGWNNPTIGSSDYLNSCLGIPFSVSVPDNQFGVQAARSGNGYAGFLHFLVQTLLLWLQITRKNMLVLHLMNHYKLEKHIM